VQHQSKSADLDSRIQTSRIKGVAFKEFLSWFIRQNGPSQINQVIATMPADMAKFFNTDNESLGVLPSVWYPAPVVHRLLDGLTANTSRAQRESLARQGSREVMNVTLRGIYKRLMSMLLTPQLYARFAGKIWRSYYDTGVFEVVIENDNTANCTVADWAAHHEMMCNMNIEAASAIYEAMGKHNVRTERPECVGRGDPLCRFITTWS